MAPHDNYDSNCPANLLVASNGPRKGVRVQASHIKKEFIDDDLIGRGPPGTLHYNDLEDFESTQGGASVIHSYKITEVKKGGSYTVVVEFINSVKGPNDPYARFEGADSTRIIAQNGLNGYEFYGQWFMFELAGTNSTVSMNPQSLDGNNIVITLANTWIKLVNDKGYVVAPPFEISGTLFFRDRVTLSDSSRAFYTNGAIIFYRLNGVDPDHIAYFIPSTEFLPGQAALFENIGWAIVV